MQMKILPGIISGATAADPRASLLAKMEHMWDVDEVGSNVIRYDKHKANHISGFSGTVVNRDGLIDQAMDFNSTSDICRTAANSITGTGSFAMCQFVHFDSRSGNDWIAGRTGFMSGSTVPASWHVYVNGNNAVVFTMSIDGSLNDWDGSTVATANGTIAAGNTYFIYWHYDSTTDELAISVENAAPNLGTLTHAFRTEGNRLWWGLMTTTFPHNLDGWIDCINYFNEPLTQAERDWVYNGGAGRIYEDYLLDDPYQGLVSFLMFGNGTDGSTGFTDRSFYGRTITTGGNTQVDTAQSKYGGASALFDGASDYLTVAYSQIYDWFDVDYTVEFWLYANSHVETSQQTPIHIGRKNITGSTNYWSFGTRTSGVACFYYYNGAQNRVESVGTVPTGQWVHLAMVNDGGTIRLFIDGQPDGSAAISGTPQSISEDLTIGMALNVSLNGWMDDIRITRGAARYTAAFTPPDRTFKRPYMVYTSHSFTGNGAAVALAERLGFQFTVGAENIPVNQLGHFASGNGVVENIRIHRVSDGALIAEADSTGVDVTWVDNVITPVVLVAGQQYTISYRASGATRNVWRNQTGVTVDPRITVTQHVFGSTDDIPTSVSGNTYFAMRFEHIQ